MTMIWSFFDAIVQPQNDQRHGKSPFLKAPVGI